MLFMDCRIPEGTVIQRFGQWSESINADQVIGNRTRLTDLAVLADSHVDLLVEIEEVPLLGFHGNLTTPA